MVTLTKKFTLAGAALLILQTLLMGSAMANEALAKNKQCMSCHAIERKLVGPSFKDIAKRYAGTPKAVELLTGKVINGGAGVWGAIPMSRNSHVNEAEAKQLVEWILAQ